MYVYKAVRKQPLLGAVTKVRPCSERIEHERGDLEFCHVRVWACVCAGGVKFRKSANQYRYRQTGPEVMACCTQLA